MTDVTFAPLPPLESPLSNTSVGKVRWKRFAALMIPAGFAAGGLMYATATGALAADVSVSGQPFSVSAKSIDGTGFKQYGTVIKGNKVLAVSGIESADIDHLCQVVKVPILGTPIKLTAGDGGTKAHADNLLLSVDDLTAGNAKFTDMNIGVDAGGLGGQAGTFGQTAGTVHLDDVKQNAYLTTAGSFTLPNLHLSIGSADCG